MNTLVEVATISVSAFSTLFPSFHRAANRIPGANQYLFSLANLCHFEAPNLSVTETRYSLHETQVRMFDVKVNARFEDDLLARIKTSWQEHQKGICPLRRGICIGLLNDQSLLLSVGNSKMFYSENDAQLFSNPLTSKLVLSEKANGEYTMLSSCDTLNSGQWLVFGSKNVRIALPFDPLLPQNTLNAMDTFSALVKEEENAKRFSYVKEMIPLWLETVSNNALLLNELKMGTTLVGEQVGVHAHIFTGYTRPHIRLFASLRFAELTTHLGCNLLEFKKIAGHQMVDFSSFEIPLERTRCEEELFKIASGPMETFGEGVVVYSYDREGNLLDLFKYKCEEYAFDRKLRTLLSRLAADLSKGPVRRLKLREETTRIISQMSSNQAQFLKMDPTRIAQRIEALPAMVAFLDRHQRTDYCSHFSEHFTDFLRVVLEKKAEYGAQANKHFMHVEDKSLPAFQEFLLRFNEIQVELTPLDVLVDFMAKIWKDSGGFTKFQTIGIASSVGGGKTRLLHALADKLTGMDVSCKVCDRDAYAISHPFSPGNVVHMNWIADISKHVHEEKHVVLVGNTFAGRFSAQFEKQSKTSLLLFVFEEENPITPRVSAFSLECLRRLSRRQESHSDGSTLSMQLGAWQVVTKYFEAAIGPKVLQERLQHKTAFRLPPALQREPSFHELQRLEKELKVLKKAMQSYMAHSTKRVKLDSDDDHNNNNDLPSFPLPVTVFPSPPPSSDFRINYVGLHPTRDCKSRLHALAETEQFRTDCHITLCYRPTAQDLDTLLTGQVDSAVVELEGKAVVTVTKNAHSLTFVVFSNTQKMERFLDVPPHATVGSTDFGKLPAVTSAKVVERLVQKGVNWNTAQSLVLGEEACNVLITPLPENACSFEGSLAYFCVKN